MSSGKVLLIANNFPPVRGGSAVVYDNLARYSQSRVAVLASRLNYVDGLPVIGWREHDRQAPYRVVRLNLLRTVIRPAGRYSLLQRLRFRLADIGIRLHLLATLARFVVTERARVICLGELLASGWIAELLRYVPGLRTVIYVHGEEITTVDPYDQGHPRRRRALLAADRIVVVSRFTQQIVRELLGAGAEAKLSLVENGVDTSRFRPQAKRRDLVDLYGLDGCFVFVSVCRLLEKKGVDNAIRAFAGVARRYPECRYLIVGQGSYEDTLRRLTEESGVADKITFVGQVSDRELPEHYCLGDVFVMPNRELANGDTEGFGLVFLEANGCGLPVIAGSDGGSTDAVQHQANGLVVDGTDVSAIEAAMLRLREDEALREAVRRRGLEAAAAADWRDKTKTFVELCEAALRQERGGGRLRSAPHSA